MTNINNINATQAAELLLNNVTLHPEKLFLQFDSFALELEANNPAILNGLRSYFAPFFADTATKPISMQLLESKELPFQLDWINWSREEGKTGRKDAYVDLSDARLVKKVKTGMLFLQSSKHRIAAGPCLDNLNQVINFINSQLMNFLQQEQWLICHAAAVSSQHGGIAFAGFSGGGKSTTMLHLLNHPGFDYLTNDRLFVKEHTNTVVAKGIPKLPRVNPGTLLNNDSLKSMLSEAEKDLYLQLPLDELWQLEHKYDVDVEAVYGQPQRLGTVPLKKLIILNWHRDNQTATAINLVDLSIRKELLAAVMKSSGPFYQYIDGSFYQDYTEMRIADYLTVLENVDVYEVTGGVDFDTVVNFCLN